MCSDTLLVIAVARVTAQGTRRGLLMASKGEQQGQLKRISFVTEEEFRPTVRCLKGLVRNTDSIASGYVALTSGTTG